MIKVLIFLLLQQGERVNGAWSVTFDNLDYCALKGTSVEFRCSYSYPDDESVRETAWYRGMLQNGVWERVELSALPSYKSRFEYQGDRVHNSSLLLHDLQESDTGHYYFWFDTDKYGRRSKQSVFLSVTGLKASIKPERVRSGDNVTLECQTECEDTRIIWFRDGRTVTEPRFQAQMEDSGNYSCAIEGLKSLQSDPVALDVWYSPLNVSVEVHRSVPLLAGSSVTLTCRSSANPAAEAYTWWYSSGGSGPELQVGSGSVLRISSAELTHNGAYSCQARNRVGWRRSAEVLLTVEESVHPFIVLGIGIKVIILLLLPLLVVWLWKRRSRSNADKEAISNDYENVIFG